MFLCLAHSSCNKLASDFLRISNVGLKLESNLETVTNRANAQTPGRGRPAYHALYRRHQTRKRLADSAAAPVLGS